MRAGPLPSGKRTGLPLPKVSDKIASRRRSSLCRASLPTISRSSSPRLQSSSITLRVLQKAPAQASLLHRCFGGLCLNRSGLSGCLAPRSLVDGSPIASRCRCCSEEFSELALLDSQLSLLRVSEKLLLSCPANNSESASCCCGVAVAAEFDRPSGSTESVAHEAPLSESFSLRWLGEAAWSCSA